MSLSHLRFISVTRTSQECIPVGCVPSTAVAATGRRGESARGAGVYLEWCVCPGCVCLGCARFTENLSELTKTWSSGATECGV